MLQESEFPPGLMGPVGGSWTILHIVADLRQMDLIFYG